MIAYELDKEKKLLIIRPEGPLSEQDFKTVAGAIDPFIEESGSLAGLIIQAATFPGWQDFAGLVLFLSLSGSGADDRQCLARRT